MRRVFVLAYVDENYMSLQVPHLRSRHNIGKEGNSVAKASFQQFIL